MSVAAVEQVLLSPRFRTALYAGNLAWHGMAFYHFALNPARIIRSYTRGAPVQVPHNALHSDIARYLGGMNLAPALLALFRLISMIKLIRRRRQSKTSVLDAKIGDSEKEMVDKKVDRALDILALASLCIANASQAFSNFTFARTSGRWTVGQGFGDLITVLDALFTVLDGATLVARVRNV